MSQKANPTTIGIFIAVGLALAVAGLLLFSSSRLFSRTGKYIIYFDTSLNGLHEGAPVKFRGVTVGSVYRLLIHYNQTLEDPAMPVIIEVQEQRVRERIVGSSSFQGLHHVNDDVNRGLRASLETESIVTGVLYVSLEFQNNPLPPVYHQQGDTYVEIPSKPTDIQQLMRNLAKLDISSLENKISALVTRIDRVVAGLNLDEISSNINNTLTLADRVIAAPDLTNSLTSIRKTLDDYRVLADKLNNRVDPVAEGLTNTLAQASAALVEIRNEARNLRDVLAPGSPLHHDLTLALQQLGGAAQSISELADFYRNHPNAVITGRRENEKKP